MEVEMKSNGPKRHYDRDFKIKATKLCMESGKKQHDFEKEMGIGSGNISHWKREFAEELGLVKDKPNISDQEKELLRLKRENQILKEERDILKKAMGIFSQPLK